MNKFLESLFDLCNVINLFRINSCFMNNTDKIIFNVFKTGKTYENSEYMLKMINLYFLRIKCYLTILYLRRFSSRIKLEIFIQFLY